MNLTGADSEQRHSGGEVHEICAQMGVRDVQKRAGCAVRSYGNSGGPEGERRVHQDGGPLRARAWWHQQQQLRQRGADPRHRHPLPSASESSIDSS